MDFGCYDDDFLTTDVQDVSDSIVKIALQSLQAHKTLRFCAWLLKKKRCWCCSAMWCLCQFVHCVWMVNLFWMIHYSSVFPLAWLIQRKNTFFIEFEEYIISLETNVFAYLPKFGYSVDSVDCRPNGTLHSFANFLVTNFSAYLITYKVHRSSIALSCSPFLPPKPRHKTAEIIVRKITSSFSSFEHFQRSSISQTRL